VDIPELFLGNGSVNKFLLLGSRFSSSWTTTMEELCFLRGPYLEVISETRLELSEFCAGVCEERT
jgi:hypothetical protein